MSRVFTPRRMAALEDQVREFCARSLDPFVGSERFDIVAELGSVMPMRVIVAGTPQTPAIDAVLTLLGRERTRHRLAAALGMAH